MFAKPWSTVRTPEPDLQYVALLTELPLNSLLDLPEFTMYFWRIQSQLRTAPGLMGYSFLANPLEKRFWTLSVWEDETSLNAFVVQGPHRATMKALGGKLGQTQFIRWTMRGSEYPPLWSEVLETRARKEAA